MIPADVADISSGIQMHREHRIAFWDAMLIATNRRAGVQTFISEDLQNGRAFGDFRVFNPFAAESGPSGGPFGLHEDPKAWQRSFFVKKIRAQCPAGVANFSAITANAAR